MSQYIYIDDTLDSSSFDPIAYINSKFPSEQSLQNIDTYVIEIGCKINNLDDEISKAVQAQSRAGEQATRDITEAQIAIKELFEKIGDIKSKASQSERMVQEICADIKKLDCAKNHLQSTITSLKRLQMLITAVGQLELMTSEFKYREVSNLLDAVKQLMSHFEIYTSIPKIAAIKIRVDTIQATLKRHVHESFKQIGQLVETVNDPEALADSLPGSMQALSDACSVVDALGPQARKDLMDEFVQLQMLPYERIFAPGQSHYGFEHLERRWAWIKRLIRTIDAKFGTICPKHWRVAQRLCLSFNERTKMHLTNMLTEHGDNSDVTVVLKSLQSTLRFEQEMRARFEEEVSITSPSLSNNQVLIKEKDPATYRAEREALKGRSGPLPTAGAPLIYLPEDPDVAVTQEETLMIKKILEPNCISGIFEQFLGQYVLLERRNLEEMLDRLRQEEGVTAEGRDGSASTGSVYGSSISMFVFIKNSIKRCTALTTGPTFLSLSREFKTCFQNYAESLRVRCPPLSGQPPVCKLPPGAETSLCYIINTCEYCSEVTPQLESMIKAKIHKDLVDSVSFESEVDAYMDVLAYSLNCLQSGIMDKLDAGFKTMQSFNWGSVTTVGEESSYLYQWQRILQELLPRIREALSDTYFRTFCTKLATNFLTKYLDGIVKQKRISEIGTQQLLLDTYNVKTLLLHFHHMGQGPSSDQLNTNNSNIGSGSSSSIPPMYMKLITSKITQIEIILKLVGTPEELILERFKIMWPDGTPNDLQMIMSLAGVSRVHQQQYLESLGVSTSNLNNTASPGGISNQNNNNNSNNNGGNGGVSGVLPGISTARLPTIPLPPLTSSATVTANATVNSVANSVRSLTQDLSSTARSAVGDLRKGFLR